MSFLFFISFFSSKKQKQLFQSKLKINNFYFVFKLI
ncbi:hypothetical protein G5S_0885 [Chlamydia pecorum E58]|uniref:Uncharacterized protein n=1 Tax=Chlamydia pecorum (strain ATCC VR-628 / DSM 29919 / E58) TaxID=331635 RepID=A0AA34RDS5_CHLPE|nr:hypothetical protein G5S_0885 [Chlamydia pecorum E58]